MAFLYHILTNKTFYIGGILSGGITYSLLSPARDDLKYKLNHLLLDVEYESYKNKNEGVNNKRVEIDYSTNEAKSLARKEFMGDPFAKVKLNKEFTNVLNSIREKLG